MFETYDSGWSYWKIAENLLKTRPRLVLDDETIKSALRIQRRVYFVNRFPFVVKIVCVIFQWTTEMFVQEIESEVVYLDDKEFLNLKNEKISKKNEQFPKENRKCTRNGIRMKKYKKKRKMFKKKEKFFKLRNYKENQKKCWRNWKSKKKIKLQEKNIYDDSNNFKKFKDLEKRINTKILRTFENIRKNTNKLQEKTKMSKTERIPSKSKHFERTI